MDRLTEKFLNSKQVFDGKLLKVFSDEVELPNGNKSSREIIRHPGAVAIVPILNDGRIVMVRQYRYPIADTLLEIPAGKLDAGETPKECAVRELSEETGYVAHTLKKLTAIVTTPGFTDEVIHIYLATDLEMTEQHTDEDEFINMELYSKEELRVMIDNGMLSDAKTLVGLLLAGV
ncbi:MAG: NUDIX hydrolase [Pelosinus sp.]|nr:NUDIX hydrolase [Pelosinus sp.]